MKGCKMKILSLNLNRNENLQSIKNEAQVDIYAFQESKIQLTGRTRINTINIVDSAIKKEKLLEFEKIWNKFFPWLEFPENYFAESEIDYESFPFILINVHLAGFRSELRQLLMFVLLKRLNAEDLKFKNIILVGDFNAERVHGTATKQGLKGSRYLDEIIKIGFEELKTENENLDDVKTFYDANKIGHRYDHAFIKYKEENTSYQIKVKYFPEENKTWFSDHRGIILEIEKNLLR